ncbi:MAG: hypothetical protein JWO44_1562 [Bacteroidetes bacterium]|jgi:hypothetical protein|nr:hypothetical protein [Bacteroidota bacterium]
MRTKIRHILFDLKTALRKPRYSEKVFCIGYYKTGTSSCGKAFELLGYRNRSFNKKLWRGHYANKNFFKILEHATKFDSFDDAPWLKEDMIPLLDKVFPRSKFVYLERDEESWLKSLNNWTFKQTGKYPDLEKGLADYRKHRAFVLDYFKDRPADILIMKVSDEDAFVKLAKFLGKETTHRAMPHENKT